jgi:hypothetical protein
MNAGLLLHRMGRHLAVLTVALVCVTTSHSIGAAEAAPTKLAVFDFELEDSSAGASIAGDRDVDDAFMRSVSAEVRRTFEQSGRYQLVDVSDSDAQAVEDHSLRKCNGCEAEIAAALGAEQSLTGVVRRITRTEYVVSFQLRDVKTGDVIAYRESDLRMGANDSWSRGAASLVKTHLLEVSR